MSDQRITDLQALLTDATRASDRQTREIERLRRRVAELERTLEARDLPSWMAELAARDPNTPMLALNESLESFRERVRQWKPTQDPTLEAVARAAWEMAAELAQRRACTECDDDLARWIRSLASKPAAIAAVVAAGKEGA